MNICAAHQAAINALHAAGKVAFVTFDIFNRSIWVEDFGPGSWMTTTLKMHPCGKVERY